MVHYKRLLRLVFAGPDGPLCLLSLSTLQDCVSVFSENSYRWLIAEQGIMKAGGCNAVRGATAPVAELR